jgi:putative ABC transport system substrate-binding protein
MRRREFITLLGGAAAAWPLAARAQQSGKLPTIGFLGASSRSGIDRFVAALVQRLHELGWIDGRTVAIEYRWADAQNDRMTEIATEFVRMKVDIIVTHGTAAVIAAKQATSIIPIVFAVAADPVGTGLVASLARPGGNVTGLSIQQTDTAGKRLELLRQVISNLQRLAIIANLGSPGSVSEMLEVQTAAKTLGLETSAIGIRRAEDIAPAFKTAKGGADAVFIVIDPLLTAHRVGISILAVGARLPTISGQREFVDAGSLISYGPNFPDLFRRAGDFVNKILRGAKPADLPIEQPTKFDLVVNLTTAKALGLTIPQSLLAVADEVIE